MKLLPGTGVLSSMVPCSVAALLSTSLLPAGEQLITAYHHVLPLVPQRGRLQGRQAMSGHSKFAQVDEQEARGKGKGFAMRV